eukprot:TRINITY_DN23302_c0_g1_i1.p1 TRINITY_DN23302_c0_g1~~TRINITY_DN23302_c0_g1_i1.p1  ORF type:complete len:394 (-),score=40.72 TRINITY_DN23302_c0_g1_i1:87-1268(-)
MPVVLVDLSSGFEVVWEFPLITSDELIACFPECKGLVLVEEASKRAIRATGYPPSLTLRDGCRYVVPTPKGPEQPDKLGFLKSKVSQVQRQLLHLQEQIQQHQRSSPGTPVDVLSASSSGALSAFDGSSLVGSAEGVSDGDDRDAALGLPLSCAHPRVPASATALPLDVRHLDIATSAAPRSSPPSSREQQRPASAASAMSSSSVSPGAAGRSPSFDKLSSPYDTKAWQPSPSQQQRRSPSVEPPDRGRSAPESSSPRIASNPAVALINSHDAANEDSFCVSERHSDIRWPLPTPAAQAAYRPEESRIVYDEMSTLSLGATTPRSQPRGQQQQRQQVHYAERATKQHPQQQRWLGVESQLAPDMEASRIIYDAFSDFDSGVFSSVGHFSVAGH